MHCDPCAYMYLPLFLNHVNRGLPFLLLLLFLPSYLPRSARAGIFKCGDYVRVTSQSANGCYGCELWLNATLPFGKHYGRAARIAKGDVVVVASEPRLCDCERHSQSCELSVRGRPRAARHSCGTARCLVDVCPCSCSTFCGSRQSNYVFFVDANVQLCNPLRVVVGDFGGKSQSDIAGSLLDALRSLRLYVPSSSFLPIFIDFSDFIGRLQCSSR